MTFFHNTLSSADTVPEVCAHNLFFKPRLKICFQSSSEINCIFQKCFWDQSLFFIHAVVNKAKMLSAGVAEAVLKFLRSEMPPVQFKLLGTLRMLIDAQGKNKLFSMLSDSLWFSLWYTAKILKREKQSFSKFHSWSHGINLIHMQKERNMAWFFFFFKLLNWLPGTLQTGVKC